MLYSRALAAREWGWQREIPGASLFALVRLCFSHHSTQRLCASNAVKVMFAIRGDGGFAGESAEAKHQWHTKWLLLMFVF